MKDLLFEPIRINTLEVKNRIFMPAMHLNMCRNFEVSDRLVDFYAERARGGAGMITVGYASVDELSAHPAHIGAHRDEHLPGLSRLATAIREQGARSAVQLNHAGRYNHSMLLGGKKPVAPSAIASRLTGETPRALEVDEIGEIVARFARAAVRVREAGFDAVEILAGTGYLISQFLSPLTNRRDDHYGGCFDNRARFGVEVVAAVREALGGDFPLTVRVNGNDFMPGGIGTEELQEFAVRMVEAGADALCVNVGWHEAAVPQIVTKVPRGVFAYLARGIRERVAERMADRRTIPVIASHRINDPAVARDLLEEQVCDAVAMGRALIADPRLPEKSEEGREQEIVHCVACGQGCFDNLFRMKAVECLCNPRVGREAETVPVAVEQPRKVMVVGGGAAGISAALAAAERGHRVLLFEKEPRLGGQLHLAGAPPGREEFAGLAGDLARQVTAGGIKLLLGQEVDDRILKMERPDALILATGGRPASPPIEGANLPHVVQAWDLLGGQTRTGKRVVIVGGGAVGVETALTLAEQGTLSGEALKFLLLHGAARPEELMAQAVRGTREIVLVEMLDKVGSNFGRSTRWGMLQDLERFGITSRTASRVLEITPSTVRVEGEQGIAELPADTVVLAAGTRPYNPLQQAAAQQGIPCQVVGDAQEAGMAFDAIHQGFAAGGRV